MRRREFRLREKLQRDEVRNRTKKKEVSPVGVGEVKVNIEIPNRDAPNQGIDKPEDWKKPLPLELCDDRGDFCDQHHTFSPTANYCFCGQFASSTYQLTQAEVGDILFFVMKAGYISQERHEGFLKVVRALDQWREWRTKHHV